MATLEPLFYFAAADHAATTEDATIRREAQWLSWCLPAATGRNRRNGPANPKEKRRGAMPERLVSEPSRGRFPEGSPPPHESDTRGEFSATTVDHCPIRRETLSDGFNAELVQASEWWPGHGA